MHQSEPSAVSGFTGSAHHLVVTRIREGALKELVHASPHMTAGQPTVNESLVEPVACVVSTWLVAGDLDQAHRLEKGPAIAAVIGVDLLTILDILGEHTTVLESGLCREQVELALDAAVQWLVNQLGTTRSLTFPTRAINAVLRLP